MRRLYYMADSVDDAESVTQALRKEGIGHWHLHVLAKDQAGLYTHKIHSANPIHQTDLVHTSERYAVAGLVIGLILAYLFYLLYQVGVISLQIDGMAFLILGGLGLCFGAWEGGMVGLTRENYKIERYHEEIEDGRYLIMVDVSREQRPLVKELMNFEFPQIPYRGGGTTMINPLANPKRMHHQTTH